MKVIYADSLFLLNLIIDYLLCLVSARVCGLYLKRLRYLAAAVIGAVYAVLVFMPGCAFLRSPIIKIAAALTMGAVSYAGEAHFVRCCAVFAAVSAAFGGAVWAISMAVGLDYSTLAYLPVSMRALVLSFALCYAAMSLIFRRTAKNAERKRVSVRLGFLGRENQFYALYDTGNGLYDPVTGRRVMVVTPHALRPILVGCTAIFDEPDPVSMLEKSSELPELAGKLRLIPFSSVGGSGMLAVFKPESLILDGKEASDLLVAVSASAGGENFEAVL